MVLYTTGFEDTKIENVIKSSKFNSIFEESLKKFFNSDDFEDKNPNFLEKLKSIRQDKENYVDFFMKLLEKIINKENLKKEEKNVFELLIWNSSFKVIFYEEFSYFKKVIQNSNQECYIPDGIELNNLLSMSREKILSYLEDAIRRELIKVMSLETDEEENKFFYYRVINHFGISNSFLQIESPSWKWGLVPSSLVRKNPTKEDIDKRLIFWKNDDYLSYVRVYGGRCFFFVIPRTWSLGKKTYRLYEYWNNDVLHTIKKVYFSLTPIYSIQDSREKWSYFIEEKGWNAVVYLLSENGFQKMILEWVKEEDIEKLYYDWSHFYICYSKYKKVLLFEKSEYLEVKFEPKESAEYKLSD